MADSAWSTNTISFRIIRYNLPYYFTADRACSPRNKTVLFFNWDSILSLSKTIGSRSKRSSILTFLICLKLSSPFIQWFMGGTFNTLVLYVRQMSVISFLRSYDISEVERTSGLHYYPPIVLLIYRENK